MSGIRVRVTSKRRCQVGEAPHWDEKSKALLYVDAYAGNVSRLDPDTHDDIDHIHFEGRVSFAIPVANQTNKVVLGHNHYVKVTDMKKKREDLVAVVETENAGTRLNDAKCDAAGRLWTGAAQPWRVTEAATENRQSTCWGTSAASNSDGAAAERDGQTRRAASMFHLRGLDLMTRSGVGLLQWQCSRLFQCSSPSNRSSYGERNSDH
ncbi:hypothetical protein HPB48_021762 [Haemaphysalis longicornis]|uniref:SMP-30/Gluconolactonase/LRE-like region domain-containing protein n=1 Tax=Haemaphysalis longicornis TaxID=44386 RepID=A0A9J6FEL8_HAELO|nr:hypothetical protein HPB48_021762 [Haemaphysalis longicornis]